MAMTQFDDRVKYEIIKTKISEIMLTNVFSIDEDFKRKYILYYLTEGEEETGLFAVTVVYTEINDNDKPKKIKRRHLCSRSQPERGIYVRAKIFESCRNT